MGGEAYGGEGDGVDDCMVRSGEEREVVELGSVVEGGAEEVSFRAGAEGGGVGGEWGSVD